MKKFVVWVLFLLLLSGCSRPPDEMETGMKLRSRLLQASTCSFEAKVTADYGDKIHTFVMNCSTNSTGDVQFTVAAPETISGITGKLSAEGGDLTFDDTALHFDLIAEQQLSPISAPWILLNSLRSGYMTSACREDGNIRLSIDDSFDADSLRLDLWLNAENVPKQADILYDGRRILSVTVDKFEIL